MAFRGTIYYGDGDQSGNYWEWKAVAECENCGMVVHQKLQAEKARMPEGFSEFALTQAMEHRIKENHVCKVPGVLDLSRCVQDLAKPSKMRPS